MGFFLRLIISNVFSILQILIVVRAFLSWMPHDSRGQYTILLYTITESILGPIRSNLPVQSSGFDLSPIIAFFLLGFLKKILLVAV